MLFYMGVKLGFSGMQAEGPRRNEVIGLKETT
jgi:hypothetical protein